MEENVQSMNDRPNPNFWKDNLKKTPFRVPEGYFDALIDQSISQASLPVDGDNSWKVPSNYFNDLEQQIRSRIAIEELCRPSQLSGNKNDFIVNPSVDSSGFEVDDTYFVGLENKIKAAIRAEDQEVDGNIHQEDLKQSKTIPFRPKQGIRVWARYAAAACAILVSGVFINQWNTNENQQMHLENIPEQEIINYLSLYSTTGDWISISNAALEAPSNNMMNDLTDDEIRLFLENSL